MKKNAVKEGLFQITGFSQYGNAKVHLEKDGHTYSISLRRIGNRIIGKTIINLRIFLSDAGNWLVWDRNNMALLPNHNGIGYGFRERKVVTSEFAVSDYKNLLGYGGKNTRVVLTSKTNGKQYETFLHDIKDCIESIYEGDTISLIESTIGGSYVWRIKRF